MQISSGFPGESFSNTKEVEKGEEAGRAKERKEKYNEGGRTQVKRKMKRKGGQGEEKQEEEKDIRLKIKGEKGEDQERRKREMSKGQEVVAALWENIDHINDSPLHRTLGIFTLFHIQACLTHNVRIKITKLHG